MIESNAAVSFRNSLGRSGLRSSVKALGKVPQLELSVLLASELGSFAIPLGQAVSRSRPSIAIASEASSIMQECRNGTRPLLPSAIDESSDAL